MEKMNLKPKERIVWVDVLRFLAIFMVICVHCSDPFNISPEARSNPEYNLWGGLYGSLLRPCVPLFVMITGLLLLPVRQSIGDFYHKRLMRIAVPFLLWSVLYNLFPWVTGLLGLPSTFLSKTFAYASPDASQSLADALKNIALIPVKFNEYTIHTWYLYMLIGLYLYLPFFSAWVEKATVHQKRIFLALWAVTLFLPYVYQFYSPDVFGACAWNSYGTFYCFAGFNGYLLLGHYLTKEQASLSVQKTVILSLILFVAGYVATYFGFRGITENPHCTEREMELFFLYCSPNVMLMTTAVFLLVSKIRIHAKWAVRLFANLTKCGLGIYLIHYFVVGFGYRLADILQLPISVRIPISAAIVMTLSWLVVAAFYHASPKSAKWVFG
jgi:surface polysaccharide O-acyltransferase-like enzyme